MSKGSGKKSARMPVDSCSCSGVGSTPLAVRTFEGTVEVARSTLSLSAMEGKRGTDSHVMTHSVSLRGDGPEFLLEIETDIKTVENPE